jgi:beta-glucanase (GH16 family)
MSEILEAKISRSTFLKVSATLASSLFLADFIDDRSAEGITTEQFSNTPSWSQDFSKMKNGRLDRKYWNYVTGNTVPGYTDDAETYTNSPSNVRIEDGVLILEAILQNKDDRKYTSSEVDTQGKFGFVHGKLEATIRLPKGIGTWPAAWLLPTNPKYNPAKFGLTGPGANWELNGEIDFMETTGFEGNRVYPDIHTTSTYSETNSNPFNITVPNDTNQFYTYGLEKTAESIVFTLNGKPVRRIDKMSNNPESWPFEQEFYLIFNLAMGGEWGSIDEKQFPTTDGIQNSNSPWLMEIKNIDFFEPIN